MARLADRAGRFGAARAVAGATRAEPIVVHGATGTLESTGGASGSPPNESVARRSLKSRAVRGSIIWGIAYAMLQVIRLGGNVWLGQLLLPWAFGMVAIARAIQQGLSMFSELGIRPAMIQSKRDDDLFVNTAWTLGAIRGAGIWAVASMLAYPLAVFYGRDALVQMVPVLALTALLSGLESTRVVSMNRELREGPRAAMEVGNAVLSRSVMIVWAYISPTPWALVAGTIAGGLFSLVVSHVLLPGRVNRFTLERDAVRSILKFGSWIFIGTVIAFLGQQLDKILLGKLDGLGMLGVYTMALTLAAIPREMIGILSVKILYPALSEVAREDPTRYSHRVRQIRAVLVPCGAASILGVVFVSPWFFTYLYTEAYHAAAWISPLACGAVWFAILNASANKALLAMGQTRTLAFAGAVKVALTALGCAIGYRYLGVAGFVIGVTLGGAGEHLCNLLTLRRVGMCFLWSDGVATAGLALLAAAGWFAPAWLGTVLSESTALAAGLLVQGALVSGAAALAVRRAMPFLRRSRP